MMIMIRRLAGALIANKTSFSLFILGAFWIGIFVQLRWIHNFCGNQPFFGGTGVCGDNAIRIILGGPLGFVTCSLISLGLFYAYVKSNIQADDARIVRAIGIAFASSLLTVGTALNSFRHFKLYTATAGLVFAGIVIILLRGETWNLLKGIKKLLVGSPTIVYGIVWKGDLITFSFRGKLLGSDQEAIFAELLEELMQLDAPFRQLRLDLTKLDIHAGRSDFILYQLQALCACRGATFELITTPAQKLQIENEFKLMQDGTQWQVS